MSIDNFIAEVHGKDGAGLAKSNRYMVVIDVPRGPSANNLGQLSRFSDINAGQNQYGRYSQLINGQRLVNLYCEATSLPSMNIDTKLNKQYGPGREIPYGHSYTPVNFTFYMDREYTVKKFFDAWQRTIIDPDTSKTNYYNEYVTSVHILALDAKDSVDANGTLRAKYQCTLIEAYPKTVAEIAYSASNSEVARLQVSMQFRKWKETTAVTGIGSLGSNIVMNDYVTYNPVQSVQARSDANFAKMEADVADLW